jgi:uncharacterized protein (DUF58 family)
VTRPRRSSVVLALGAGAFVGSWLLGSLPFTVVGIGLVGAAVAARLWSRGARGHVRLERRSNKLQNVEGDDVRIGYHVERASRLPAGGAAVRERVGRLGLHQTRLRRGLGELVLESVPRGRYGFEEASVVLEDPLGLERVVVPVPPGEPLLVVPRIAELGSLFSESGRHGSAGRFLLLRRPSGFDLHSVREYEEGESLRKVHWPTTARRGQLMVKDLEESPRDDIVVLVDCDVDTVAGPPGDSSFDAQLRAAGSLLRAHASRGRRCALVLTRARAYVARLSSLEDWPTALELLAAAEPDEVLLVQALADERGPAARAPELVVVTARLDERAVDRLAFGGASGRRVSVVWVDAASYAGRVERQPQPALLRLATGGVPVAVVRRGDDLRRALEAGAPRRRSA